MYKTEFLAFNSLQKEIKLVQKFTFDGLYSRFLYTFSNYNHLVYFKFFCWKKQINYRYVNFSYFFSQVSWKLGCEEHCAHNFEVRTLTMRCCWLQKDEIYLHWKWLMLRAYLRQGEYTKIRWLVIIILFQQAENYGGKYLKCGRAVSLKKVAQSLDQYYQKRNLRIKNINKPIALTHLH